MKRSRFGLALAALLTSTVLSGSCATVSSAIATVPPGSEGEQQKLAILNLVADRAEHSLQLVHDGQQIEIALFRQGLIHADAHATIQRQFLRLRDEGKPILVLLKNQTAATATREAAIRDFVALGRDVLARVVESIPAGSVRTQLRIAFGAANGALAVLVAG